MDLSFKSIWRRLTLSQLSGLLWGGATTKAKVTITEGTALEVSAVFCAARVIAEGLAQMPLKVKRRTGERTEVLTDHPLVSLLRKPNSWQTGYEFVETMGFIAAVCGNFVALKTTAPDGRVLELIPLPPGTWSVRQEPDHRLIYTVTADGRDIGDFRSEQVLHVRGIGFDGCEGLEPVKLAREALGLSKALEWQQSTQAGNGGRPSGVLSTDKALGPEDLKKIRDGWSKLYGSGGSGGIAVLDLGWKFSPMQTNSVDAQLIETRKYQIEEIARAFRVFPQMLMQTDKASTFASAEQFFRAHVIHTLGPWMKRIEAVIFRDLLSAECDQDVFADFEERALLRGDFRDQADFYTRALGAGGSPAWMTQNEVRREQGLDPDPNPEADQLPARLGASASPTGGA